MLKMTENVPDEKLKTEEKKINRPSYKTLYEDLLNKQPIQKNNLLKYWNEINLLLTNSLLTINKLLEDDNLINRTKLWKTHIIQLQLISVIIKDFNRKYNNSFKSTILDELNNKLTHLNETQW